MSYARINLYCGCLLLSMGYGLFFTMPLYLRTLGADESTAGSIILAGAIGTLTTVMMMANILRRVPAHLAIVSGAIAYAVGSTIFASTNTVSVTLYVASVLLGAGWGTTFTLGPILLSQTVTDARRSFYFSILSAFNALGMGIAPIAAQQFLTANVPHKTVLATTAVLAAIAAFFSLFLGVACLLSQGEKHLL